MRPLRRSASIAPAQPDSSTSVPDRGAVARPCRECCAARQPPTGLRVARTTAASRSSGSPAALSASYLRRRIKETRLPRQQRLRSSRKPLKSDGSAGPTGQIVELQSISAAVWPADRRSPKKRPRLRAANVLRRTTPVLLYATYWNNVRSRLRNDRSRGARMYSARRATNSSGASASALGIAVSLSAISSHPRSCASSAAG